MSEEIKVTLVRSHIGKLPKQRAVLNGLGLKKINQMVVLKNTPEVKGMIAKVSHLVQVQE
jgi:large subunit ribosomal protein L30